MLSRSTRRSAERIRASVTKLRTAHLWKRKIMLTIILWLSLAQLAAVVFWVAIDQGASPGIAVSAVACRLANLVRVVPGRASAQYLCARDSVKNTIKLAPFPSAHDLLRSFIAIRFLAGGSLSLRVWNCHVFFERRQTLSYSDAAYIPYSVSSDYFIHFQ